MNQNAASEAVPDPAGGASPAPATAAPAPRSLKKLALRGAAWILSGYAAHQALRLAGNIILARLLFPEAFGLMALVSVFMQGLQMFSDLGIGPSIIQNKRGTDPRFLDTAWTIQIVRGIAIWLIACMGAVPFAMLYDEPILLAMIPVSGLVSVISGFNSTALFTANREVRLGKLTVIDFTGALVTTTAMLIWAWYFQSVWALVGGGLVGAWYRMLMSHAWLAERRDRMGWDPEAAREMYRFGRWIFGTTAATFISLKADRLLLGALTSPAYLGFYWIAHTLGNAFADLVRRVGAKVLFPVYSSAFRERDEATSYRAVRRSRMVTMAPSALFLLGMYYMAEPLIGLLYDARYDAVALLLQVICLGLMGEILSGGYANAILARGRSAAMFLLQVIHASLRLGGMLVGYRLAGGIGVVWGLAAADWCLYLPKAAIAARHGLWQPEVDGPVFAMILVGLMPAVWLGAVPGVTGAAGILGPW